MNGAADGTPREIAVIGGGAAGFFGAIACAEAAPGCRVTILEAGRRFLEKVRISGGGRCNVTHACFDPKRLAERYPRGGRALIGPFSRFGPREAVDWFAARGVALKTEPDGRMFPVTDSSRTVIDCLLGVAARAGVALRTEAPVARIEPDAAGGGFALALESGERLRADRVLLASGGCRNPRAARPLEGLGHGLLEPVPSLFAFHLEEEWARELAGLSVAEAAASSGELPGSKHVGPLLFTHEGLSGPAILRLSAWGARAFSGAGYRFGAEVRWVPGVPAAEWRGRLARRRAEHGARRVAGDPALALPARLWEALALRVAGLPGDRRWSELRREEEERLAGAILRTPFAVVGKSLNKEEFVTCGGVPLGEVDFRRMESRRVPGLHFAGEILDVDGVTGGFNFQAAWTTGWIAGHAMAAPPPDEPPAF